MHFSRSGLSLNYNSINSQSVDIWCYKISYTRRKVVMQGLDYTAEHEKFNSNLCLDSSSTRSSVVQDTVLKIQLYLEDWRQYSILYLPNTSWNYLGKMKTLFLPKYSWRYLKFAIMKSIL